MTFPERKYLVLASQRSGSTLLTESLRATGIAGRPEEFFQYLPSTGLSPQPREWFAPVSDESVLALLAPLVPGTPITESSVDWRDRILRAGASPNGVWGGKLMWNQVPLVLDRAAGLPSPPGAGLRAGLAGIIGPDPLLLYVYREDVVAQAVSFWRAVQTQTWRGSAPAAVDAKAQYHAAGIAHLVQVLREQERGWTNWFAGTGIEPVRISYAELAADTTAVVAGVLRNLGLDPAAAPPAALERQANSRSQEWVQRYLADARQEGLPV